MPLSFGLNVKKLLEVNIRKTREETKNKNIEVFRLTIGIVEFVGLNVIFSVQKGYYKVLFLLFYLIHFLLCCLWL